jgi:hypothetical protein
MANKDGRRESKFQRCSEWFAPRSQSNQREIVWSREETSLSKHANNVTGGSILRQISQSLPIVWKSLNQTIDIAEHPTIYRI